MRYLYKQTGLIVESGVELGSVLFEPIPEKNNDALLEDAAEDTAEDTTRMEKAQAKAKSGTTARKKTSTAQKK